MVKIVLAMCLPDRQRSNKHRKKSVAMNDLRETIRNEGRRDGD